jgi:NADPH-dependent curcumin reductase CurA
MDYSSKYTEAAQKLGLWKMSNKIKDKETLVKGLERAPHAINMLFEGANTGKLLIQL